MNACFNELLGGQMNEQELRKHILDKNKTERINFSVSPEMKATVDRVAEEKCTTVSVLLTACVVGLVLEHKGLSGERSHVGGRLRALADDRRFIVLFLLSFWQKGNSKSAGLAVMGDGL